MGVPDAVPSATMTVDVPTPPHLYPQAIQLKLYQAFIFSIPILFSIILFLLFYLFYLKRTTTRSPSPAAILPTRTSNNRRHPPAPFILSPSEIVVQGKLKERLPTILFADDDDLGGARRDSLCCICLGEFMAKEELIQLPGCRHLFHLQCIHHWLWTNSTCPLCRSTVSVLPTTPPCKLVQSQPSLPPSPSPTTTSDAAGGAFQVDQLLHYNNDQQQQQQHRLIYSSAPAQQQQQQSQPQTQQACINVAGSCFWRRHKLSGVPSLEIKNLKFCSLVPAISCSFQLYQDIFLFGPTPIFFFSE